MLCTAPLATPIGDGTKIDVNDNDVEVFTCGVEHGIFRISADKKCYMRVIAIGETATCTRNDYLIPANGTVYLKMTILERVAFINGNANMDVVIQQISMG